MKHVTPSALVCLALLSCASPARAAELPEYRLKAAFLYNFALFTEWPAEIRDVLTLCILGQDPFGEEVHALQGKSVGARRLVVQLSVDIDALAGCNMVYIAPSAMGGVQTVLAVLRSRPVLTVADTPGAARQGVAINMAVSQDKVSFEANVAAARSAGLQFSSKLLHLATQVIQ